MRSSLVKGLSSKRFVTNRTIPEITLSSSTECVASTSVLVMNVTLLPNWAQCLAASLAGPIDTVSSSSAWYIGMGAMDASSCFDPITSVLNTSERSGSESR